MLDIFLFLYASHVFINISEYKMHQFVHKTNIQYIKKWHHKHHIDYPPGKPISSIYNFYYQSEKLFLFGY